MTGRTHATLAVIGALGFSQAGLLAAEWEPEFDGFSWSAQGDLDEAKRNIVEEMVGAYRPTGTYIGGPKRGRVLPPCVRLFASGEFLTRTSSPEERKAKIRRMFTGQIDFLVDLICTLRREFDGGMWLVRLFSWPQKRIRENGFEGQVIVLRLVNRDSCKRWQDVLLSLIYQGVIVSVAGAKTAGDLQQALRRLEPQKYIELQVVSVIGGETSHGVFVSAPHGGVLREVASAFIGFDEELLPFAIADGRKPRLSGEVLSWVTGVLQNPQVVAIFTRFLSKKADGAVSNPD